jgi:sarcosine oxidase, subunit beta
VNQTADVVVIGGGVVGAATAFHLAEIGVSKTVLLERTTIGAGATARSGAIVRMHYTNPHDVALAHHGLPYFQHWDELVGTGDCGFVNCGVVRLVAPGQEAALRANVEMMQRIGVNTTVIGPSNLREIDPTVSVGDVEAAAWEPDSGYANPLSTAAGFAEAARKRGATILLGTPVTRLLIEGDRIAGVETPQGTISTRSVVLAAGAWGVSMLADVGIDLGLQTNRIQVVVFRRPDGQPVTAPVYIDGMRAMWVKPEGTHDVMSGYHVDRLGVDPNFFNEGLDWDFIIESRRRLTGRFPSWEGAPMRGGWSGVVGTSPDGHAIIDQLPQLPGLFVFQGDSGTNFKTAPAIGKCLAEWIMDGAPKTVDLHAFRSSRFAEGAAIAGIAEYGSGPQDIFR